eukprot:CAMPEP_0174709470 /NCGR_PEP_ID=MMETSP1094-20130205/11415_1 /TAXON_ID=156173 /ORGANISM="Chrysochromulina brevifilum, Strain UTEX LB 985" /LENGTH=107 /DNA_ID=CAMNT_0015908153 /DNA_START=368 /DNA_END=690 /DNA_ORIENTATION=-
MTEGKTRAVEGDSFNAHNAVKAEALNGGEAQHGSSPQDDLLLLARNRSAELLSLYKKLLASEEELVTNHHLAAKVKEDASDDGQRHNGDLRCYEARAEDGCMHTESR